MGCSRPRLVATEKNVGSQEICKLADVKLDEVAALLYEQRLRLGPSTPAALEGEELRLVCLELVAGLAGNRRCDTAVLVQGGRVVGLLAGERQLHAPEKLESLYQEYRSVQVPLHGFALAEDIEPFAGVAAMYGHLSGRWLEDGFMTHTLDLAVGDRAVTDAWVAMGFGGKSVCVLRETRLPVESNSTVATRLVDPFDEQAAAVADQMHRELCNWQAGPPMFWPYNGEPDADYSRLRNELLAGDDAALFLAGDTNSAKGAVVLIPPLFVSRMLDTSSMLYLWEGVSAAGQRGEGTGSALLAQAMAWAHGRGVRWCALHFASANSMGAPFWAGHGFVPVADTLKRVLDPACAWARGTA